jgi:hypothetical protein
MGFQIRDERGVGIALAYGTTAKDALAEFLADLARGKAKREITVSEDGVAKVELSDGRFYEAHPS